MRACVQIDPFSTSVPSHILRLGCHRAKRHLVWNPGNGGDRTTEHLEQKLCSDIIDKSCPTALLALVTQIAGEWALVPCTSCHDGLGDWASCVIPPLAQGGITSWACANCVRREDGQGCSLRSGTTPWRHLQSFSELAMSRQEKTYLYISI